MALGRYHSARRQQLLAVVALQIPNEHLARTRAGGEQRWRLGIEADGGETSRRVDSVLRRVLTHLQARRVPHANSRSMAAPILVLHVAVGDGEQVAGGVPCEFGNVQVAIGFLVELRDEGELLRVLVAVWCPVAESVGFAIFLWGKMGVLYF